MQNNEYVVLKGSVDGVNMMLDSSASMNDILDSMREKIKSANGFFKGECNVYVGGRDLSKADKLRITSVMNTVFPEANIVFRQEITDSVPEITAKNHTDKGARFMQELMRAAEESKNALKGSRGKAVKPQKFDVKLYSGNVSQGESLSCHGDLLVVGNVEAGGLVEATGNIYIMGRLNGIAVCNGDYEDIRIMAAEFKPQRVSIGDKSMDFHANTVDGGAKMAYLMKGVIFIEKIL